MLIVALLLVALAEVSVQQCTTEFERVETIVRGLIEGTDATITINRTTYNCLSASPTVNGAYASASVSILYGRSNSPNQLQGVRYNLKCVNNQWTPIYSSTAVLINGRTRVDCANCLDQTVNEDHCTCKSWYYYLVLCVK